MVPGKASRLTSWKAVPSVREMVSNHPPHCNPVFGAGEVARTLQLQEYLAKQENAQSAMAEGASVHSRAILAMVRAVVRSKRICR
jgi:hypothetical protein